MEGVPEIRHFKLKFSLIPCLAMHFLIDINTSMTILSTHSRLPTFDFPANDHRQFYKSEKIWSENYDSTSK